MSELPERRIEPAPRFTDVLGAPHRYPWSGRGWVVRLAAIAVLIAVLCSLFSCHIVASDSSMTSRKLVATSNAPAAIGPYSQAVVHGGLVYCSGQIALDPKTGQLAKGDVKAQTKRVLENLQAVLEAAGSGCQHALKCTIYLSDMGDFAAVNEVYAKFFPQEPPARATVGVASLPKGALVEIDCVAIVPAR
jgi:2-iminobutanoate/2-iminopropanoate deaminase